MIKYLVVGLTSSCTKIVARMIALNLGIIEDIGDWDGREDIESEQFLVSHRSLPHGHRNLKDRWIDPRMSLQYDYTIIVTRDINCSRISTVKDHQPDKALAMKEAEQGVEILKDILDNNLDVYFFSYETAQILQDHYTIPLLQSLGIKSPEHAYFKNINKKYVGGSL
jgi:hypothetical protein